MQDKLKKEKEQMQKEIKRLNDKGQSIDENATKNMSDKSKKNE